MTRSTDPSSRVLLMLMADGRSPTGGYAHSGGLEAALGQGLGLDGVPAFLSARLRTIGLLDATFAAHAARANEGDELSALEAQWLARTPSPSMRRASGSLGRALLRLCRGVGFSSAALEHWATRSSQVPRPLVLGAACAAAGGDPLDAASLSLYDDAATVCSAAPKLAAVDTVITTSWLAAERGLIAQLAACAVASPDLPSTSTPGLDRLLEDHARQSRRLFAG